MGKKIAGGCDVAEAAYAWECGTLPRVPVPWLFRTGPQGVAMLHAAHRRAQRAVRLASLRCAVRCAALLLLALVPALASAQPLELPRRTPFGEPRGELFARPPERATPRATPARAQAAAPMLPFRYAGRSRRAGEELAFLAQGDQLLAVRPGDVLPGGFRVRTISDAYVELAWLPGRTLVRLPLSRGERADAGEDGEAPVATPAGR